MDRFCGSTSTTSILRRSAQKGVSQVAVILGLELQNVQYFPGFGPIMGCINWGQGI